MTVLCGTLPFLLNHFKTIICFFADPSSPADVTVTNYTTSTVSIRVSHGEGNVEYFNVLINKQFQVVSPANKGEQFTDIKISSLPAGNRFDIDVYSEANDINSTTTAQAVGYTCEYKILYLL